MPVGAAPKDAVEVNALTGQHLRQFVQIQETINHDFSSLSGIDLKVPPYEMSADDETTLKTAIAQLNTALQAVDMTFINRCTGLF